MIFYLIQYRGTRKKKNSSEGLCWLDLWWACLLALLSVNLCMRVQPIFFFFDSLFPTHFVLTQVRKQAECGEPASNVPPWFLFQVPVWVTAMILLNVDYELWDEQDYFLPYNKYIFKLVNRMNLLTLLKYSEKEVQKEEDNRIKSKSLINKTSVVNWTQFSIRIWSQSFINILN